MRKHFPIHKAKFSRSVSVFCWTEFCLIILRKEKRGNALNKYPSKCYFLPEYIKLKMNHCPEMFEQLINFFGLTKYFTNDNFPLFLKLVESHSKLCLLLRGTSRKSLEGTSPTYHWCQTVRWETNNYQHDTYKIVFIWSFSIRSYIDRVTFILSVSVHLLIRTDSKQPSQ